MTKVYQGIDTDPGTGAHKVPVATAPTGAVDGQSNPLQSQIVTLDVGDGTAPMPVSDANPLPAKVTESALPAGAATEASLLTSLTALAAILSALQDTLDIDGTVDVSSSTLPTGAATEATLASILTKLQATLAITVAALPLPTGAAAETTLAAINTKLGAALPLPTGAATQATLAAILTALVSVAVTGPLTDTQLRASALPLPLGAATQTTLAAVLTALQAAIPAGTNLIGSVTVGANASTTAATLAQAVKTVAAIGTPEALVASSTLVECVQIQACKGFNSANATPVFIGQASGNDANYLRLRPWGVLEIRAAPGKKIDLHQIFIDVLTAGDGVSFLSIN